MMESGGVQVRQKGCVVAAKNFVAFKAAAEGLNIPVNVLTRTKTHVVLNMNVNDYAMIQATINRVKLDLGS